MTELGGHGLRWEGLSERLSIFAIHRALYRAQGAVSTASAAANLAELVARVGREPGEAELEPLTWAGIRNAQKLSGEQVFGAWRRLRQFNRVLLLLAK